MNQVGGMHVEQPSENLVDEVLDVIFSEVLLGVDNSVKVCLHKLGYNVDVGVASFTLRLQDVQQSDDIFVVEEL